MTRRRPAELELSTFPFLSVLCAVIGVLMLIMIVIMATRVIGSEAWPPTAESITPQADAPGIDEATYEDLNQQIEALTAQLRERSRKADELRRLHAELVELLEMTHYESRFGGGPEHRRVGAGSGWTVTSTKCPFTSKSTPRDWPSTPVLAATP